MRILHYSVSHYNILKPDHEKNINMSVIDPELLKNKKAKKLTCDYKAILNPEQYKACITTEGPVLIVAGAGTGKTNTLIKRVMYLVDVKHVDPERILLLTFTNKAAKEMLSRAKSALDERCARVKGCTYHSFCAEWLRHYSHLIGIKNNFVIYDTTDSADAFNLMKERQGISREDKVPSGKELVEILSAAINKKKSLKFLLQHVFPEYEAKEEEIKKLIKAYRAYKLEKNVLDYDDLITKMNKLLKDQPDIAKKISDTYKYIMVDEYQDSNLIQLELLTLIRQFNNKNICVVGDDFQSIYGFRGANFRNIMDFPKQFQPCKVITLYRNYRSNQEILDLSNEVMKGAKERYDKKLKGLKHAGHKPYLVRVDSSEDEAELIRDAVATYHNKGIAYKDMAVIIHSSNTSSFLEVLFARPDALGEKVPFQKFGGIRFMERKFVKDIFAILKIIINKSDEISWFRILQLLPGLGAAGAKNIARDIISAPFEESSGRVFEKCNKKKYAAGLKKLFTFFADISKADFQTQIANVINVTYPKLVMDNIQTKKVSEKDRKALMQTVKDQIEQAKILIDIAEGYKNASTFVTELTLESPDGKQSGDYVTITTVHSVKGLEFKVVFLMDCVDGSFPWRRQPKADTPEAKQAFFEEMEEERRVFYVAITRAKDDLYLFVPEVKKLRGNFQEVEMSPYLADNDIYENFCDIEDYRSSDDDEWY